MDLLWYARCDGCAEGNGKSANLSPEEEHGVSQ